MRKAICAKCGKETEEGLCEECFLKEESLFSIENISADVCVCKSYRVKKWKNGFDVDRVVKENMKGSNEIDNIEIMKKEVGNKVFVEIAAEGKINGKVKKEKKKILIKIRKILCPECSRKRGGYYQAVVQMRVKNNDKIVKNINSKDIVSIAHKKEGYDIKFMSKAEAEKFVKKIGKKYKIKKSFKLAAEKKGQKLYRNYYSVKEDVQEQ